MGAAGVPAPYVPGMDVAGVVDEIGPGTDTDLSPGEPVMAMVLPFIPASDGSLEYSGGGYAEYVVLAGRLGRPRAGGRRS